MINPNTCHHSKRNYRRKREEPSIVFLTAFFLFCFDSRKIGDNLETFTHVERDTDRHRIAAEIVKKNAYLSNSSLSHSSNVSGKCDNVYIHIHACVGA